MNEEEKQAIDTLQNCIADYVIGDFCAGQYCPQENACKNDDCPFEKAIDTVVNLIEKQNKVIDKMYSYLDQVQICRNINKYSCIVRPEKCKKCILDYFYKEIENE